MKRKAVVFLLCIFFLLSLGLCGCNIPSRDTKVVLGGSFGKDELFYIGNNTCTRQEYMVYLTNMQNQYEDVYGEQIWKTDTGDETLEEGIKQSALARISQVKMMYLLAKENGITLDEQEKSKVDRAAKGYYNSLTDQEKKALGVDETIIRNMFQEYVLAGMVYSEIISTVNPEISDDEARIVTVEHLFIKTYSEDEDGTRREYSDEMKKDCLEKINTLREEAVNNSNSFREIARKNSDLPEVEESFGIDEKEKEIEQVAFNLGKNEISEVIVTKDGYHVLKCTSTLDQKQTDENKIRLVEKRRKEAFTKAYDDFVNNTQKNLNEELFEEIELLKDKDITTSSFFDYCNQIIENH